MAQITNIITIHEYNKMTAKEKAALSGDNLLAVVQQDWEEARIQAAIAAMQGQLANDESVKQMIETLDYASLPDKTKAYMNLVAQSSVMLADALIEERRRTMKNYRIENALLIASCVLLLVFLIVAIGCGIYELIKTL